MLPISQLNPTNPDSQHWTASVGLKRQGMYVQPGGDARSEVDDALTRQFWWSIQPQPLARPISARRAYAEVLGVVAVFFAADIIAAGESLSGRYPLPSGSWAVFVPGAVSELSKAGLAALVVILLAGRRGITARALGFGWPARSSGRPAARQAFRVAVWAVLALLAGGLITSALATGKLGQPVKPDDSYLLYAAAASFAAGVVEEMVVLAFVVTTLRQACRPMAEIVIVAVLLRCSYHIYYGPGVVGIAVWAALFVWLFLRSGSVVPLIAVHFLWDLSIFFEQKWHAFAVGRAEAYVLLPIAAGITWLVDRRVANDAVTPSTS